MRSMYYDQATRSIVDLSPVEGGWEINRIKVTPEAYGQGIGRRLMGEVLADADTEQTVLYLYVNPYGNLDWDALTSWYHRLGFEPYLTEAEMGYGDADTLCPGALRRRPQPKA